MTAALAARGARSHALVLALVVGSALVVGGTARALKHALAMRAGWPPKAEALLLPRVGALRVMSLGHPEMAADLIAARTNVYFGTQIASHGEHRLLGEALETAVELDPRFHRMYLQGAAMLVYTGKEFSVEALTRANALLERGERVFPADWELPFQRGFNLLFELPKVAGEDEPRVPEWREKGVEALREAATLDGAPPWLPNLVARMLTKEGGEELAIRHLERAFAVTSNEDMRREITHKLVALRGQRAAGELAAAAAALARAVAERYPYAPEAFSVVIGPRAGRAVDLDALLQRRNDAGAPATSPAPSTGATP